MEIHVRKQSKIKRTSILFSVFRVNLCDHFVIFEAKECFLSSSIEYHISFSNLFFDRRKNFSFSSWLRARWTWSPCYKLWTVGLKQFKDMVYWVQIGFAVEQIVASDRKCYHALFFYESDRRCFLLYNEIIIYIFHPDIHLWHRSSELSLKVASILYEKHQYRYWCYV